MKMGETVKRIQDSKKEEGAAKALEYYRKIHEMLETVGYSDSHRFLDSIREFIEENQCITSKQCEILDRIYRHPNYDL